VLGDKALLPAVLGGWKNTPALGRLKQVRAFVVSVAPEKPAKLLGGFRCPDEAAAKKVEQQDLAPRANDKGKGFKYSRDKVWLTVRLKVDAAGPGCGKTLKVKDEVAGKKVKWPGCGQVLRVGALAVLARVTVASGSRARVRAGERYGGQVNTSEGLR
jgi:hypothetical protein